MAPPSGAKAPADALENILEAVVLRMAHSGDVVDVSEQARAMLRLQPELLLGTACSIASTLPIAWPICARSPTCATAPTCAGWNCACACRARAKAMPATTSGPSRWK